MSDRFKYKGEFQKILKDYNDVSIVRWNRLEGRPRAFNFERALKAEVRDPLWMLSRQWQTGEFIADDAGSPIETRVNYSETSIKHQQSKTEGLLEDNIPLETFIEHQPINFQQNGKIMSLDIRLLAGRQWLKILSSNNLASLKNFFLEQYPIKKNSHDRDEDGYVAAHFDELQQFNAVAGRMMDGGAFYFFITNAANKNSLWSNIEGITKAQEDILNIYLESFITWFERLFYKPNSNNKDWIPSRLEYGYEGQVGSKKLIADEYYHGHADWYNFNLLDSPEELSLSSSVIKKKSFIPTQVMFEGMPNKRWWEFEDSLTNFGSIEPDKTDITKLLLINFGLMYTNDWFLLPLQVKVGNYAEIESLTVRNVFGENILIKPSSSKDWDIFGLSGSTSNGILLQNSASIIQEGSKNETVNFIRDEVSNMVWGIEAVVPLASGASKPGDEVAERTLNYLKQCFENGCNRGFISEDSSEVDFAEETNISWQLMNSPPENWIPFIPVQLSKSESGDEREIQLQRARIPRVINKKGTAFGTIEPKTNILRVGLDNGADKLASYFIAEEEVPRTGVIVSKGYRRTRASNGKVHVWSGVQKSVGRGQGTSGLAFDQISPIKK